MTPRRTLSPKFKLWLRWLLANFISSVIGTTIGGSLLYASNELPFLLPELRIFALLPALLLFGLIVGSAVSLAQWWALGNRLPHPQRWVWASTLCSAICITASPFMLGLFWVLGIHEGGAMGAFGLVMGLFGLVSGFITGLIQWLTVLRRLIIGGWWLLASSLGCGLGLFISNIGKSPLEMILSPSILKDGYKDYFLDWLIFGAVAGAINGAITGFAILAVIIPRGGHPPSQ